MRINDILVEFAPSGDSGGSGDYFQALASAWYNGTFDTGSLQKGIKSQQDVEQLLQRGIIGPDGVTRKYGIDYNSTFDGVVISSDDYYEHADHDETDSRTGKPFGPYDYMEFGDEELDESAKYRDPKYKDQLYTQEPPDYNDTREYDRAMFGPKPKDYPGRKELPGGGEYDRTDPLVRGAGIGRSGIKNNILDRGKRKGLPSRDQITSLKQSIRDISGRHTRANLPEQGMAEGLPQTLRKIVPGYAKREIDKKMDAEKFGRTDVDRDANYYRYKKIQDKIKDKGVAEGSIEKTATGLKHHGDFPDYPSSKGQQFQTDYDRLNKSRTGRLDKAFDVRWDPINKRKEISADPSGVDEGDLNEKSTSQAQFRTMAAAAHDPKFAKKVGIKQSVAREFNKADRGQDYKSLPKKATEGATVTTTPGSIEPGGAVDNFKQQMANNTERDMAEGNRKSEPPEADYGDDYQDMVKRVKRLAGLGPLKTVYDPAKRVYRNMPTAVQPKK